MPHQQLMIERANAYFNYEKLQDANTKPDPGDFPAGTPLGEVLTNVGIAKTAKDVQVANSMPIPLAESLKTIVRSNLERKSPYAIQFLWWPSEYWDLDCVEVPPVTGSVGGISVLLKSKPDPSP